LQTYWEGVIEEHGKVKRKRDEEKENNPSSKRFRSVITLTCLIQGNTPADAFEVDIEESKSISKLKDIIKKKNAQTFANVDAKDIKLWKALIPDDHNDQLRTLTLQHKDELFATKKISKYFPVIPPEDHIHVVVKSPRKYQLQYTNFSFIRPVLFI
jgi:hypothetical protein